MFAQKNLEDLILFWLNFLTLKMEISHVSIRTDTTIGFCKISGDSSII